MADTTFTTPAGQQIAREQMVAYLNTGEYESPVWSAIGRGTPDSSLQLDWQRESNKDILGNTENQMKKPIVTQDFDPLPPYADDTAAVKIWNLSIKEQNAQALSNQDMLIVHYYTEGNFAERYDGCSIEVTDYGGEGGGNLTMSTTVTYGGNRTVGTATRDGGSVKFTEGRE